jgi:hypothetical protein
MANKTQTPKVTMYVEATIASGYVNLVKMNSNMGPIYMLTVEDRASKLTIGEAQRLMANAIVRYPGCSVKIEQA